MATTTEVGVKITVDGSEATKSVGSIKSQLKEATAELIAMREKFGDTSDEAVAAAKKVGKLKDSIGDAKAMADAFSPDQKFKAFGQALQGVAGGFAAVQGAMGLMGSESKDVEKMLLKVNSAMALSQGIDSVLNSADAFQTLGKKLMSFSVIQKTVTAAQKLFNTVMAANPIGVMITAITALIAGVALLTKYFYDNAKAAKLNEASVKANAKALEQQQKATAKAADELNRAQNYQLAMAKANGATTASIRALELKLIDEKIATERASRETAINTFEKNKNALASLKQAGASDEVIKSQKDNVDASLKYANEVTANLNKSHVDREELVRKHNVEIATEQTTANNEASQKRKKDNDDAIAKRNQAIEDRKKLDEEFAKELRALEDKNFIDAIKDENRKAEELLTQQFLNDIRATNASLLNDKQKNDKRIELGKQYQIQIDAINAKRDEEEQKKLDDAVIKEQERIAKNNEIRKADYEKKKKLEEEQTKKQKEESDARIALDKAEKEARENNLTKISSLLGNLSDLIGKQTGAGKAFAVAQATIDTYLSATKAYQSMSGIPVVGPALGAVSAGVAIATGIKNVKSILSVKVPGGTGGGSVPSGGNVPSITPPLPPQLATQTINGGQINQLASATARAYVVESDVSGNQERINRLNRASRIN